MAKAIYCLKLQMLKSQLSRRVERRPEWNKWPSSLLGCTASKGMRHQSLLNDFALPRDPQDIPDQTVAKAAEQARDATCGTFSEENAGLAFFDSRIDVEKQMVKDWTSPLRRRTQAFGGKKDDYVFLPLVLRHFEDTVLFSETRRGRGLPGKGPGIVGGGRPFQGGLRTGHLPSEWSTMPRSGASP
ncbi:hypothetical protein GWK47_019849 [Chionoecetes opilio]|uniref:Uncharacterized protein n=1 Tax=Chionoecetes opilio TaxID=41210 RepID=A0A8J5CFK8_CHIOP|nr:hypothetical protein GWK47_019849 [Chionoecetes opilio]